MSVAEEFDDESALVLASEQLLADRGPLTLEQLVDALQESGHELGDDAEELVEDELYESDSAVLLPLLDDRWVHSLSLLSGRTFTHRLTALEIEHDVLRNNPDLEPILVTHQRPGEPMLLVDGTPLSLIFPTIAVDHEQYAHLPPEVFDPFGVLALPAGYLAGRGVHAGDHIGLRISEAGLELPLVDDAEVSDDWLVVRDQLASIVGESPDHPRDIESTLLTVCADRPDAFRVPLPPLSHLIAESGLAHEGDYLAVAGFDFARYRVNLRVTGLRQRHELTEDEALAVLSVLELHRRAADLIDTITAARDDLEATMTFEEVRAELGAFAHSQAGSTSDDPRAKSVRKALEFLDEPVVAESLWIEAVGDGQGGAEALSLVAEELVGLLPRSVHPALRWLQAKAEDRLGNVLPAEESLQAAHRLDPDWSPALEDLARFASDRGDAVHGLTLLRRAEDPDPWLLEVLERFQPTPGPARGRNEPCWCGSGRKFKQCHLHRPAALPLAERARWLYEKAAMFVADGPWRVVEVEVARRRATYAETEEQVHQLATDPLIRDAVLFEGGAFEEFVEVRGILLPDDERLLAEEWLLIDRSVFEVVDVHRGEGFAARDLRTGDVHSVRDRAASLQLQPAGLICTRIVPAGETVQVFGGIEPVKLAERDDLLGLLDAEPDPEDLVAFLSRRFAPPRLTNTEGDPLAMCEATVTVPLDDQQSLVVALDATYRRLPDTEAPEWHEVREIDGFERVLASLRLHDGRLAISANSERRMNAVLSRLRELHPDLTVLTDERQSLPDVREVRRLAERSGPKQLPSLSEQPPEIRDALAAHMREYERKWLDMPVPALGGRSPRNAANDPTRREDLLQLLAEFPLREDGDWVAMNPERIRADLGL